MQPRGILLVLNLSILLSSAAGTAQPADVPARPAQPEVWLCAGRGLFDLLRPDAQWPVVKRGLSGIKLYIDEVNNAKPEQLRQFVRLVREQGYQVAVECGCCLDFAPMDETNGETSARIELAKIDKLYAAGGKVEFLDLDGPIRRLMHPENRRDGRRFESMDKAADEMVDAVRALHRAHPEIRFWHLTNFPNWGYRGDVSYHARGPQRQDYGDYDEAHRLALRKLNAAGFTLEGVTIDNPYDYLVGEHMSVNLKPPKSVNWLARVRAYEDAARADGLSVNLIVNSERGGQHSDGLFYRETLQMVDVYQRAGGRPTRWFVQSWYPYPKTIVPEDAPHTLTALAKAVLQKVRPDVKTGPAATATPIRPRPDSRRRPAGKPQQAAPTPGRIVLEPHPGQMSVTARAAALENQALPWASPRRSAAGRPCS